MLMNLNFEEDIIIKRADGKDTVRTKTVTDGLQKDFEPIDLYSGIGVPLKISEQMYRLLDGDNEEKVDTPGAEGVGPANDMDCLVPTVLVMPRQPCPPHKTYRNG